MFFCAPPQPNFWSSANFFFFALLCLFFLFIWISFGAVWWGLLKKFSKRKAVFFFIVKAAVDCKTTFQCANDKRAGMLEETQYMSGPLEWNLLCVYSSLQFRFRFSSIFQLFQFCKRANNARKSAQECFLKRAVNAEINSRVNNLQFLTHILKFERILLTNVNFSFYLPCWWCSTPKYWIQTFCTSFSSHFFWSSIKILWNAGIMCDISLRWKDTVCQFSETHYHEQRRLRVATEGETNF